MRKRTAFRLLALVNLISAYEWHLRFIEGLGIGASIISCLVAGIFLYCSVHRRKLRPLPEVGATPKQKAEYNLLRVAQLVDAEEITGGWRLHSGGEVFDVTGGYITCQGKGQTCYHTGHQMMPEAERMATALLFLSKYPQAWSFWAQHHNVHWMPPGSPSTAMSTQQLNIATVG